MKNIEDSLAGPYDARTGIARGTRGVPRIIRPNHKCTAVSSRTGPVVWCDHENSTDVKFLRARHSALWLRARNRTGDKNRTGSVVGCDWGITLIKNTAETLAGNLPFATGFLVKCRGPEWDKQTGNVIKRSEAWTKWMIICINSIPISLRGLHKSSIDKT